MDAVNICFLQFENDLKLYCCRFKTLTSTDHKVRPGERHTQSQRKSIHSFLWLETKWWKITWWMTSNFAQRIQKGRKKYIKRPSSAHKNLRCSQNNLQFTLECNPAFNVQHCIHEKYLTNYNLWNKYVQHIALKKFFVFFKWKHYPQSVHALDQCPCGPNEPNVRCLARVKPVWWWVV